MEHPFYSKAPVERKSIAGVLLRYMGIWLTAELNAQAWLVCPDAAGNRDLYVNLGAYSYMTPAGCADETIHAYTGATATP